MQNPAPPLALPSPLQGILRKKGSSRFSSPAATMASASPSSSTPTSLSSSPKAKAEGRVHFQPPPDLADMLRRHRERGGRNMEELEGFITHMRNQRGAALVDWLQILQENIALLTPDLERFVVETLKIGWAEEDRTAVAAFQNFLANLVTAHSFYVRPVAFMLVCHLQGRRREEPELEKQVRRRRRRWTARLIIFFLSLLFEVFLHVHEAIQTLLRLSPLSSGILLHYAAERMPYLLTK